MWIYKKNPHEKLGFYSIDTKIEDNIELMRKNSGRELFDCFLILLQEKVLVNAIQVLNPTAEEKKEGPIPPYPSKRCSASAPARRKGFCNDNQ